jgi:hypothetical protein
MGGSNSIRGLTQELDEGRVSNESVWFIHPVTKSQIGLGLAHST